MIGINGPVDLDTASLIASEYGFECQSSTVSLEDVLGPSLVKQRESAEKHHRPPIVTIMGHVDHGKTSILDAIRETNVAAGEQGGITQHIGAYTVEKNKKHITFLDTPGHEAFSAMRSRGAKLTDIVVLVVAADDGVMPQTKEAISHARDAEVPVIVAINKIDKPNIKLDRIYTELAENSLQSEEWGGETQFVKVSALEKTGLSELLDAILLQAEVLELSASPTLPAEGIVVEAHLDRGRGPVATIIVQDGTLRVGEHIVAGRVYGKVRSMTDCHGKALEMAGPSIPVEVVGLADVPAAGDQMHAVKDEKMARQASEFMAEKADGGRSVKSSAASLEDLLGKVSSSETPEVPIIIKGDTQGSVEAVAESITRLNSERVRNRIVHKAVGGINESDISLAAASGAVIFGFNVRASRGLDDQAESQGVVIKYFGIIYDLVDAVKNIMAGHLPPIRNEVILGHAEVKSPISVPKIGVVAGSSVTDGKITRNSSLRLIRDAVVVYSGKVGSLRRFKDGVREVQTGYECGITIDGYQDVRVGDVIEAFVIEEERATL